MGEYAPFLMVAVGIAVVLGMIIVMRINAFIALICAALVVSFMAPGEWNEKVSRVAFAFGENAGKIGLVIGFAAVIGEAMMRSGAADRIVAAFLRLMGEKRAPLALMGSGFVLSVPVFFDTVFYLLVPLARSLFRSTKKNYLLSIMAICAGGAITHTLVPPTPGPLAMAENLNFDVGVMMGVGAIVALPGAVCGLLFAQLLQSRVTIADPVFAESEDTAHANAMAAQSSASQMSLLEALLPVILPVVLIGGNTLLGLSLSDTAAESPPGVLATLKEWTEVFGNPSFALLISMALALITWVRLRAPSGKDFSAALETALLSAGLIILITAAGGAFGSMLKATGLKELIETQFADSDAAGMAAVMLGFGLAALLKVAQGSSTTAMITVSGMLGAMGLTKELLGFHPVYLATAIGGGSLMGSWMNDSGFWIVARMSGMTESQALKTWTPLLAVLGLVSLLMTLLLTQVMPLV